MAVRVVPTGNATPDYWGGHRSAVMNQFASSIVALDAETGKPLWDMQLGGPVHANPMTYSVDGKQYVAIAAGWVLYTFALP